jgi:hypothetical protein
VIRLNPSARFLAFLLLTAGLLVSSGCGASKGDLIGTVKLKNGSPLQGGSILVQSASGENIGGSIEADGKYQVLAIPAGLCKISIAADNSADVEYFKALSAGGRGGEKKGPAPNAPKPKINTKYNDFTLSGLSTTIKGGKNTYDIALED